MKRMGILAFACSAAIAVTACNRSNDDNRAATKAQADKPAATSGGVLRDSPQDWVTKTAQANQFEISASELAQQRAQNPQVKQLARMMEQEHTKAGEELRQTASRAQIQLPTALDEKHQDRLKDLQEKQGADFDRAYMDAMVDAHQETLDLLEDKADAAKAQPTGTSGSTDAERDKIDRELAQWATKTAPTVSAHLEKAKLLNEQLEKK